MERFFQEGYEYFRKNAAAYAGASEGAVFGIERAAYSDSVEKEIIDLEKNLNAFLGMRTPDKILKGDAAEFWHAGTFNVNAATNRSANRMSINRSHDYGSVDVSGDNGDRFGMKYYANGQESARAQSVSVFQRFKEYKATGGQNDLERYLVDRNYTYEDAILNDPIYSGQIRVIPSDQLQEATNWLERMIRTEAARRPEQYNRYQETLQLLQAKISDNQGNSSIPLTKIEAEKLASLGKQGKFDAESYGLSAPDALNFELLIKESMKAGLTAAVISLVLRVGPEIYKAIDYLIKNGDIDEDRFKRIGFAAVSGGAEGFIRGSVASAITFCCNSGALGEAFKGVNPSVVGAVVAVTMNTIKGAYEVAIGKKTRTELSNDIVRDMFVSACALIGGGISQARIKIPVLGYMIGSFVGSMVGSFVYNFGYKTALSFFIETGFTMFGLVRQDYILPKDVIQEIGIETFDYETFFPETFQAETFNFDSFGIYAFEPDSICIKYLRRGVIGTSRIGFVE